MNVYLDFNGSAPLAPEIESYLISRLQEQGPYANPSANHFLGMKCQLAIEKARKSVSRAFSTESKNIFFTSGATESISAVFNHIRHLSLHQSRKKKIIVSKLEHSAVINCAEYLEEFDKFQIVHLNVNRDGQVDTNHLESILSEYEDEVALVCVMAANNETGVIQPMSNVSKLCDKFNVAYFCDATQILGKADFDFKEINADFLCCSGHKIGALPGVGAVIIKDPDNFTPLIIGGKQENGLRGGTQNYIGIETLGVAFDLISEKIKYASEISKRRNQFETELKSLFQNTIIFGESAPRVCNTSYFSIPHEDRDFIQMALQKNKIYVTTGSACSDKTENISHVLESMGFSKEECKGAVRLSCAMKEEVNCFTHALKSIKDNFQ